MIVLILETSLSSSYIKLCVLTLPSYFYEGKTCFKWGTQHFNKVVGSNILFLFGKYSDISF